MSWRKDYYKQDLLVQLEILIPRANRAHELGLKGTLNQLTASIESLYIRVANAEKQEGQK